MSAPSPRMRQIAGVLLAALALAGLYSWQGRGTATLEFDLMATAPDVAQVYWSHAGGFNPHRRADRPLAARLTRIQVVLHDTGATLGLRVDPVKTPAKFQIGRLRLIYGDAWLPLPRIGVRRLDPAASTAVNQLRCARGPTTLYRCQALGNDPQFVWRLADSRARRLAALGVNWATLAAAFALIMWVGRRRARPFDWLWIVGLFPLFCLIAFLARPFIDLGRYAGTALATSLALALAYRIALAGRRIRAGSALHWAMFAAVVALGAPDLLFHLGVTARPLFVANFVPGYEWRLNRDARTSFVNSSLPYYDDFAHIRKLVRPGSRFFSDQATSYYVTSALPLYATNPMKHHRWAAGGDHYFVSQAFLATLCNKPAGSAPRGIAAYFATFNAASAARGEQPIRYLILDKDTRNRNVASECMRWGLAGISQEIATFAKPLYRGQYLSLYEIPGAGPEKSD